MDLQFYITAEIEDIDVLADFIYDDIDITIDHSTIYIDTNIRERTFLDMMIHMSKNLKDILINGYCESEFLTIYYFLNGKYYTDLPKIIIPEFDSTKLKDYEK